MLVLSLLLDLTAARRWASAWQRFACATLAGCSWQIGSDLGSSVVLATYHAPAGVQAVSDSSARYTQELCWHAGMSNQVRLLVCQGGGIGCLCRDASDYFLSRRHYRGLEAPSVGAPAKEAELATFGKVGRAAGYSHEPGNGE